MARGIDPPSGLLDGAHLPYGHPSLAPTTLHLWPGFLPALPVGRAGSRSLSPRCSALCLAPSKQLINPNNPVSELSSYDIQRATALQN